MLRGTRARPALKTMVAAAALSGALAVPGAVPSTGGAGMADPAPRTTQAPATAKLAGPALSPVRAIPQLDAGVALRKVSRRAASAATLAYVSHARGPLRVRVDVVRLADGFSVFTDERTVAADARQTIRWSGRATTGLA